VQVAVSVLQHENTRTEGCPKNRSLVVGSLSYPGFIFSACNGYPNGNRHSRPVLARMQHGLPLVSSPRPTSTLVDEQAGRTPQRRLAAIFCADVAGYTRLMNTDEAGTLRLLNTHREMTDRLIQQHGGRIANTAGDSILAEFPSAVDALQCALGIQERIAAVHEEVQEERRVSFRIGLHVGEAMVRDGDLFGDGVNVAARMQSLAEPGTVCLSGSAHEYVWRIMPIAFEDLGSQSVKNLDVAIQAYLARPPGQLHSRAIPPVHRREVHLVRRLYHVFFKALTEAAQTQGLITSTCQRWHQSRMRQGSTRANWRSESALISVGPSVS
jgi:class 3 adenylate cyclase